jgi:hypothetical protein
MQIGTWAYAPFGLEYADCMHWCAVRAGEPLRRTLFVLGVCGDGNRTARLAESIYCRRATRIRLLRRSFGKHLYDDLLRAQYSK